MEDCLRKRITYREENIALLQQAVTILATNGWHRSESSSFGHESLEAVGRRFRTALEKSGIDTNAVQEEWDDMVGYGKSFLDLVRDDYKVVWWKLYNCPDAKRWENVLGVVELLFCLPVANGHLEQVFSKLKIIKTDKRTCEKILWMS